MPERRCCIAVRGKAKDLQTDWALVRSFLQVALNEARESVQEDRPIYVRMLEHGDTTVCVTGLSGGLA